MNYRSNVANTSKPLSEAANIPVPWWHLRRRYRGFKLMTSWVFWYYKNQNREYVRDKRKWLAKGGMNSKYPPPTKGPVLMRHPSTKWRT